MAEFTNKKLSARFVVPDRPTIRQQLAYYSEAGLARGKELFERYWLGARNVITEWECELYPDKNADLDIETNPRVAELMIWAGMKVKQHMDALEEVSKNS